MKEKDYSGYKYTVTPIKEDSLSDKIKKLDGMTICLYVMITCAILQTMHFISYVIRYGIH